LFAPVSRRVASFHIYSKKDHEKIIDNEHSNKTICAKSTKINTYFCTKLAYIWESFGCHIIKSFSLNSTLIKITAINECIFIPFMLQFHCSLCALSSLHLILWIFLCWWFPNIAICHISSIRVLNTPFNIVF